MKRKKKNSLIELFGDCGKGPNWKFNRYSWFSAVQKIRELYGILSIMPLDYIELKRKGDVKCENRLGGIIKHYYRE